MHHEEQTGSAKVSGGAESPEAHLYVFKKAMRVSLVAVFVISAAIALTGKHMWGLGFFTGTLWSVANFALLTRLLKMAVIDKQKRRIGLLLLLKFPVLYLVGFLILRLGYFPVMSLMSGLLPVVIAIPIVKIYRNWTCHKARQNHTCPTS